MCCPEARATENDISNVQPYGRGPGAWELPRDRHIAEASGRKNSFLFFSFFVLSAFRDESQPTSLKWGALSFAAGCAGRGRILMCASLSSGSSVRTRSPSRS